MPVLRPVPERGAPAVPLQSDHAGRAVALLVHDQFRVSQQAFGVVGIAQLLVLLAPFAVLLAVALVVVLLAVQEGDHVGVLLDAAGFLGRP